MENLMKARIEERLSTLHMNAFEAEEKAGLTRGYIYELLIGKKASIRPNKIPAIATALECTPEY
ncbi:helix-turn-helix transcriptional regulator, partial [Pseudomonas syringae pv. tagetis]|uniref:helix-turn-helix domain-containing protein n=1 Tax=Pseudomonas syringae group genomosp. 7 TaxID=251699 RepID=UPI00376F95B3